VSRARTLLFADAVRSKNLCALAIVALLVYAGDPAVAQEVPTRGAGEIVTVGVEIPAELAESDSTSKSSVAFEILGSGAGRLVGPEAGRIEWQTGEDALLPVTVALSPDLLAGEQVIARVFLTGRARLRDSVDVRIRISRERAFGLAVTETGRAAPGRPLKIRYRVANHGNSPDTAVIAALPLRNLTVGEPPPVHILDPGESAEGLLLLDVFDQAEIGTRALTRLTVEGERAVPVDVSAVVYEPASLFSGLVQIPTSVFLGTTLQDRGFESDVSSPILAVRGRGTVRPNTELEYAFRSIPDGGMSYAFRGEPYGPRYYVALRRPAFDMEAGELSLRTSALSGRLQQGAGGYFRANRGAWAISGLLAAPMAGGERVEGHLRAGRVDHRLSKATIGLRMEDVERRALFDATAGSRVTSAIASADWTGNTSHLASFEAGWMQVEDFESGEVAVGPALQALYAFRSGPTAIDFRARTVPGIARESRLPGRELRASGIVGITPGIGILGGLYLEEDPRLGSSMDPERRGLELGGRFSDGRASADVLGRVRRWDDLDPRTYSTAVVNMALPLGEVSLDGSLELGVVNREGTTDPVRYARVGAQWFRENGWLRMGLRHTYDPSTGAQSMVDLGANQQVFDRILVYLNAALPFGAAESHQDPTLQVGAEIRALRGTAVLVGAENAYALESGIDRGWKFAVGVRQDLDLAMPIERPAPLSGVAFIDLDGNGARASTEPLAEGVRLKSGFEEAVTDELGRFRFVSFGGRSSVTVDPASLPSGMLPPDAPIVPGSAHIGVPIVPATALEIVVFLDSDGDGRRDTNEPPVPNAAISVINEPGSSWAVQTGGDGTATLRSLRPGDYLIEIVPESLPWNARAPEVAPIRLIGGEASRIELAVGNRAVRRSARGSGE
jgi:hypothetical protein